MIRDFTITVYCPYSDCRKGKVYSTGRADLKTSEVCPECDRAFTVDWKELIARPSLKITPKIKNSK